MPVVCALSHPRFLILAFPERECFDRDQVFSRAKKVGGAEWLVRLTPLFPGDLTVSAWQGAD